MLPEHAIQTRIWHAINSRPDTRVFRNNVGRGWVGETVGRAGAVLTLRNPRPLHAGLVEGSGDLIGWRSVTITPDMVGRKVAVFASVEVKSPTGRASEAQVNWAARVKEAGGLAGIARSVEDAEIILSGV